MPLRHINELKLFDPAIAMKAAATIVDGTTLFTISNGPVVLMRLTGLCKTDNNNTGTTVQFKFTPTGGSATNMSIASGSLASAAAGSVVCLPMPAVTTAPNVSTLGYASVTNNSVSVMGTGIITVTVGVGSTTGTWEWYLEYRPLTANSIVS